MPCKWAVNWRRKKVSGDRQSGREYTKTGRVVIGADFNEHVGDGNRGNEDVMGGYGAKERNVEGPRVVDFAEMMNTATANVYRGLWNRKSHMARDDQRYRGHQWKHP